MNAAADVEKGEYRAVTAYWGSAYFFSVAILYLWGYWSPFHINVLEYVNLSDVVKTAAYPIASVFVFMAIGALVGQFLFPEGFLLPGVGANTRVGVRLRRAAPFLVVSYTIATVLIYLFGPIEKWLVLPVLLAVPVSFALREIGLLEGFIRSDRVRSIMLFLFATLPLFAFGQGTLKANNVIAGKKYSYVISEVHGRPVDAANTKVSQRLRYIGKAGEHYFLYSPETESVLVLPMTEAKGLELKVAFGNVSVDTVLHPSAPSDAGSGAPSGKR